MKNGNFESETATIQRNNDWRELFTITQLDSIKLTEYNITENTKKDVPMIFRCQCQCGHTFDFRESGIKQYKYGNNESSYLTCPKCGSRNLHSLYFDHYYMEQLKKEMEQNGIKRI